MEQPMLRSFLVEERMRALRRDGELVRVARVHGHRRWRPAALSARHDDRGGRNV